MTTRSFSYYTYTLTNKASILLLCALIVLGGSFAIMLLGRVLNQVQAAEWIMRHLAWPVWAMSFVIRLFEALIMRYAIARQP